MNERKASILIAGGDLVGKTALQKELSASLAQECPYVVCNKGALKPDEYRKQAEALLTEGDEKAAHKANWLLAYSFMDDRDFVLPDNTVLLQDSYAPRTLAHCEMAGFDDVAAYLRENWSSLYHFDVNVFLTCDHLNKFERAKERGSADHQDLEFLADREMSERFGEVYQNIVSGEPNYLALDTTPYSRNEVADIVLEHVRGCLK